MKKYDVILESLIANGWLGRFMFERVWNMKWFPRRRRMESDLLMLYEGEYKLSDGVPHTYKVIAEDVSEAVKQVETDATVCSKINGLEIVEMRCREVKR